MLHKSFLFLYSIGLYTLFILIWVNRKYLNINRQTFKSLLLLEEPSGDQFAKKEISEETVRLFKFFSYSCCFLLIVGLPMLFYPDGRSMGLPSLGMGCIFASSFFIVLSVIGYDNHKNSRFFGKRGLLRYSIFIILVLFVLNNGLMFRDKYTGPESIYNEVKMIPYDISTYMYSQWYFQKYKLNKQRDHLFQKLVSQGLMDETTGKFVVEKVKHYFPQKDLEDFGLTEEMLHDFQSYNFNNISKR